MVTVRTRKLGTCRLSASRIYFFVYFFVCFFVSKIRPTRKRLERFALIFFQGKCGLVTTGRPDSILGQFAQIGRRVKGQFVITVHSYLVWLLSSGSPLLTEYVMKLLFWAFCYIATRGRGLLCFAPQLVIIIIIIIIIIPNNSLPVA